MEYDYDNGKKVANVFYCRPYSTSDKHELEVNHEYIRRIFPKGVSFKQFDEELVQRLRKNINAIPRESLNGETPYNLTKKKYPKLIEYLKAKYILPDDVNMSIQNIRGDKND